ncbi:MAG: DUF4169 family protein [Myxococcales bacterium]|nr:DUF4169 family protein [Myxococcales bacterium]
MADVINLKRARRAKAAADKERRAEANRLRHGRSGADKEAARREAERAERELAGKRLERGADPAAADEASDASPREPAARGVIRLRPGADDEHE